MTKHSQSVPVAVALSGGGRTLANLLTWQEKLATYHVVGVITSNPHCKGIEIARQHELAIFVDSFAGDLNPKPELTQWLQNLGVQWVLLAGFLKVFPVFFPKTSPWHEKILNIHPSLIPAFSGKDMYGQKVHSAVIEAKARESGASVHFVNERYDEGRVVSQLKVPVKKDDKVEDLAQRVFAAECVLYPNTLSDLITGKLPLANEGIFQYDQLPN